MNMAMALPGNSDSTFLTHLLARGLEDDRYVVERRPPSTGLFDAIQDALARGDSIALTGFGTFSVKSRPARTGRNPGTGESIEIAASMAPSFKAGKTLRDAVR